MGVVIVTVIVTVAETPCCLLGRAVTVNSTDQTVHTATNPPQVLNKDLLENRSVAGLDVHEKCLESGLPKPAVARHFN